MAVELDAAGTASGASHCRVMSRRATTRWLTRRWKSAMFDEFRIRSRRKADPRRRSRRFRRPRAADGCAEAHRRLRSFADGRSAVSRISVSVPRGAEFRRRRNGAHELHRHFRRRSRATAQLFGARIFSRLEREAHPPAVAGAGGLHEGDVDALAVVRRRRDQHVRSLYARAHGPVVHAAVLRQPRGPDRRTRNRVPRTGGKASSNPASTPGTKNIRSTPAPRKAFPTTTKGRSSACCWIILIRDRTDNRASLDDVLRALNEEYAKADRFYNESDGLRAVMEEVIRRKAPRLTPT